MGRVVHRVLHCVVVFLHCVVVSIWFYVSVCVCVCVCVCTRQYVSLLNHLYVKSTFVISVLWCRVVRVGGRSRRREAEASSVDTGFVGFPLIAWSGVVVTYLHGEHPNVGYSTVSAGSRRF